ncbi:MAG: ROK family protein [Planctomycetia bacterium]|nr:ROK family protein [Planctomycetia bacterium]
MGLCLGVVIANVVKLFGTELVVLSGGISNGFTLFEAGVWETVRKYTGFKALLDPLRIEVSRIKENSAVLGAAAALIDTIAPATKLLLATSSSSNRKFEQFTLPISDSPVAETVLAVQIGSTRTRAALIKNGELDGGVVLRDRKADRSEREFHQIMNDVAEVAAQASAGREGDVAAVVLIVPCGINRQKGRFFAAPGVPELGGHALGDTFQSFGVPVFLENDANAALLFDYHYGNANDVANVLSLHLVYGIGGAVIVDGRLLHGRHGHATEFGHVSLDCLSDNRLCACRQVGCLELFASGRALEEQAASAGGDAIPVFDGNYMDIVHAAKHNHPTATQLMDGFAEHLAKGMVGIFTLFDPSLVLFTGALSQARPYFEEKIKTALSDRAFWEYGADATFRTTADPMTGELRAASVIAGGLAVNSTLR